MFLGREGKSAPRSHNPLRAPLPHPRAAAGDWRLQTRERNVPLEQDEVSVSSRLTAELSVIGHGVFIACVVIVDP